jgi:hypothetical protein
MVAGRSTQSLAVMADRLHPLLIPAVAVLLARRAVRYITDPPQFRPGVTLIVKKSITGTHQWDRGMATGLATVTLEPGELVECLGRDDASDLNVLPVTSNIDAFVERAVNSRDQSHVERDRLVIHFKGRQLREHFTVKERP